MAILLVSDTACGKCPLVLPCIQKPQFSNQEVDRFKIRSCTRCYCVYFEVGNVTYVCAKLRLGEHHVLWEGSSITAHFAKVNVSKRITRGCGYYWAGRHPYSAYRVEGGVLQRMVYNARYPNEPAVTAMHEDCLNDQRFSDRDGVVHRAQDTVV
jgi:hypothetical protein